LGTGPFALGTPPFTGGADSVEKPLINNIVFIYFNKFYTNTGSFCNASTENKATHRLTEDIMGAQAV